jgi:hypothetical protein
VRLFQKHVGAETDVGGNDENTRPSTGIRTVASTPRNTVTANRDDGNGDVVRATGIKKSCWFISQLKFRLKFAS